MTTPRTNKKRHVFAYKQSVEAHFIFNAVGVHVHQCGIKAFKAFQVLKRNNMNL